jgi:copper chaperone CopZ
LNNRKGSSRVDGIIINVDVDVENKKATITYEDSKTTLQK